VLSLKGKKENVSREPTHWKVFPENQQHINLKIAIKLQEEQSMANIQQ
jgi:hypothetical protein